MEVEGKRVFLSGPMSAIEHYNVSAFAEAHAIVKEAGAYSVYNPAIEYLTKPTLNKSHEYWMRYCIRMLASEFPTNIHVLVSLPGWEDSDGATLERTIAMACGIEVCELSEVGDA